MDSWQGKSRSPITLNKYLYANVDPGNNIDPSGHMTLTSQMAAVSTIGVLATVSVKSYQIGQSLTGGLDVDGGFTSLQTGWLMLAGMAGSSSLLHELIKRKANSRFDPTVDLYRAVEEDEYLDIISCNCFRSSLSGEPKRFWVDDINAAYKYGSMFLGDPDDWAVVGATISQPLFEELDHRPMDTFIGQTVTVHLPILPAFNFEVERYGGVRFY
jgi:hypothetical protein